MTRCLTRLFRVSGLAAVAPLVTACALESDFEATGTVQEQLAVGPKPDSSTVAITAELAPAIRLPVKIEDYCGRKTGLAVLPPSSAVASLVCHNYNLDCSLDFDHRSESLANQLSEPISGVIADPRTCLMWVKAPDTTAGRAWHDALEWVSNLQAFGYDDWRLPSGSNANGSVCVDTTYASFNCPGTEMGSLYFGRRITMLSPSPFTSVYGIYWTSTPISYDYHLHPAQQTLAQEMTDGGQIPEPRDLQLGVWAVRTMYCCTPDDDWTLRRDRDGDGFTSEVDCNDSNSATSPGAPELADGVDNDCDGYVDEGYCAGTLVDDGDGTISDRSTCLMWTQTIGTQSNTWANTNDWANGLDFAGHTDWRLPTIAEMSQLHQNALNNHGAPEVCSGPFVDYLSEDQYGRAWIWSADSCAAAANAFDPQTGNSYYLSCADPGQFGVPGSNTARPWAVRTLSAAECSAD